MSDTHPISPMTSREPSRIVWPEDATVRRRWRSARRLPVLQWAALAGVACGPALAQAAGPATAPVVIGRVPLAEIDAGDMIETPSLAIDATGTLHVVWVSETAAGERTVLISSAAAGEPLGAPRVLATTGVYVAESTIPGRGGPPRVMRRALRTAPQLLRLPTAAGEALVVVFVAATPGDVASVRPQVMRSDDGGRTFSAPEPLAGAEVVRPTFTGGAVGADGRLLFSWLDHRLGVQVPALAATRPGDVAFLPETVLEASVGPRGVCPCCPTACAGDADGTVFLAFRNQVDGYRDIHVARRAAADTRFAAVRPVVPPTWQFDGCPHDGPSLDLHEGTLTVTWMDAHDGAPRVYAATAPADTLAFSAAVRLDPEATGAQGNARLCRDASGTLHAVWERSTAAATAMPAPGSRRGGGPPGDPPHRPQGGHADHGAGAIGGRLVMHARLVGGAWTTPVPMTQADAVMQTRPAIVSGRDGDLAIACFERTAAGKQLVVSRSASHATTQAVTAAAHPPAATASRIAPGRLAYLQYCAGCHGAGGGGDGPAAAALPQPPRAFAAAAWRGPRTREGIRRSIVEGVTGTAMKPVPELSPEAVAAVVEHVAELAGLDAPAGPSLRVPDTPATVPALRLTDATGAPCPVPDAAPLTLVHVWGTTCGACLAEMPDVEALGATLADRGLRVVHLCIDATDAAAAARVAGTAADPRRIVVDPTGLAGERLGVRLLPAVRLIDAGGRVVAGLDGSADWRSPALHAEVTTLLEQAVARRAAPATR